MVTNFEAFASIFVQEDMILLPVCHVFGFVQLMENGEGMNQHVEVRSIHLGKSTMHFIIFGF